VAEEGVLKGLQRLGNRLLLQITINGHRRTASMGGGPGKGTSPLIVLAAVILALGIAVGFAIMPVPAAR